MIIMVIRKYHTVYFFFGGLQQKVAEADQGLPNPPPPRHNVRF